MLASDPSFPASDSVEVYRIFQDVKVLRTILIIFIISNEIMPIKMY